MPGKHAFKVKPNPFVKDAKLSEADCKFWGIKTWVYERDANGNKIPDYNNHYQPEISAAFAIEHVYDPIRPICQKCQRCLEGQGNINIYGIKRLRGE